MSQFPHVLHRPWPGSFHRLKALHLLITLPYPEYIVSSGFAHGAAMPPSEVPAHHNLLITTPNSIHLHSQSTKRLLFQCSIPSGIRNSRVARDNSGLLAVADSHVVLLYDSQRTTDRKYKLKDTDACFTYPAIYELENSANVQCPGRAATSCLLARLQHAVLHDNVEPCNPSLLHHYRRVAPSVEIASLPSKRPGYLERW